MPLHVETISIQALLASYRNERQSVEETVLKLRERILADEHNAWIHVLSEAELEAYWRPLLDHSPGALPLFGIPFAVKDNIDVAGIPTTAACPAFSYVPDTSAAVVARLVQAGAIPMGKTNLDQFATGLVGTRSPYGKTTNSFNQAYISGGSSAGSAVATALGQVAFALGTDTAGSGRVPAAFNNLVGHKPSHGLVSTSGVVPACRSLDCVSIMANSARDAATVLAEAAAYDAVDPYARKTTHNNNVSNFGLPVGSFVFGIPDRLEFAGDTETEALFNHAVATLVGLGGTVKTIDFQPFYEAARLLYEGPWVAERRLATESVAAQDRLDVLNDILVSPGSLTAESAFEAQYRLKTLKRRCAECMADLDFTLTPTTPTIYSIEQLDNHPVTLNSMLGTYTNFMNLLDYAATAVPVGFLTQGPSWGVTLFAHRDLDYHLLSYAALLEQALDLPSGVGLREAKSEPLPTKSRHSRFINVAVCGAHLKDQPLNWQLTTRGAKLLTTTHTQKNYRLYALADDKRPALIRSTSGSAIEVEVWSVPETAFGSFVAGIPAPLAIGKVELIDGQWCSGFVCADGVPNGAIEITEHGGWRNWLAVKHETTR